MNRRTAVQSLAALIAAPLVAAPPHPEWITVAGPARNGNGRIYPAESLKAMADTAKGVFVHRWPHDGLDADTDTLQDACGVVTEARLLNGLVQVRIAWLGDRPNGCSVSPWGSGILDGLDASVRDYQLKNFVISGAGSTFAEATTL